MMPTRDQIEDPYVTLGAVNRHKGGRGVHSSRVLVILLVCIIAGCTAQAPPTPTFSPPTPSRTAVRLGPTSTFTPTVTLAPTSIPTSTLYPLSPVSDADWGRGPRDAAVTLVVYSDFQ